MICTAAGAQSGRTGKTALGQMQLLAQAAGRKWWSGRGKISRLLAPSCGVILSCHPLLSPLLSPGLHTQGEGAITDSGGQISSCISTDLISDLYFPGWEQTHL